jgi:hypothetical protein
MSNHLAVATVTAALRQAVQDALNEAVSGAMAQVGRPKAGADDEDGSPLVNVFLYQVAADPAQRNNHLPSRTATAGPGGRRSRPSTSTTCCRSTASPTPTDPKCCWAW